MKVLSVFFLSILFVFSASADDVFRIGAILPLTGRAADYGAAVMQGLKLAEESNPEAFSNVKFVVEDTAYDGKASITAFQKLVEQDKVNAVFVWGHGPSEVLAPIAESKHFPLFVVSGDNNVAANRDFVIRFCTSHDTFAKSLLMALEKRNFKKIGMVKTDHAFIKATADGMEKQLPAGMTLDIVESFGQETMDFKSTITRLKSKSFEILGLFLGEDQIVTFLRQASDLHYHPPLFGIHSFGGKAPIESLKQLNPGAFYPGIDVSKDFEDRYVKRWGNDVQLPWAANAFDLANFSAREFGAGEKSKGMEVIEKVRSAEPITGACGTFKPVYKKETGTHVEFPVIIQKITAEGIVREKVF